MIFRKEDIDSKIWYFWGGRYKSEPYLPSANSNLCYFMTTVKKCLQITLIFSEKHILTIAGHLPSYLIWQHFLNLLQTETSPALP